MRGTARVGLCVALGLLVSSVCVADMSATAVNDLMSRGYQAIKANDVATAKSAFQTVLKDAAASSRAAEAMLRIGYLQLRESSPEALATFKAVTEQHPNAVEAVNAFCKLGSLHMRKKCYDDSQSAFLAAAGHEAAPTSIKARSQLNAAFVEIMKAHANEYWARDVDGKFQLVRTDSAAAKIEHLEMARKQFQVIRTEYARGSSPQFAAIADAAIGEIYLLGKTPALAERAYWRAIREYGTMPAALNTLARYGVAQARYHQGDPEGALEQLNQALDEFAPGYVEGFEVAPKSLKGSISVWKVAVLFELGQLDEALAAAKQTQAEVGVLPTPAARQAHAQLLLWDGYLTSEIGSVDEAVETLQSVIARHPSTPQATRAGLILRGLEMEGTN